MFFKKITIILYLSGLHLYSFDPSKGLRINFDRTEIRTIVSAKPDGTYEHSYNGPRMALGTPNTIPLFTINTTGEVFITTDPAIQSRLLKILPVDSSPIDWQKIAEHINQKRPGYIILLQGFIEHQLALKNI